MPLICYSIIISAIVTILGVHGIQHFGFDMVGIRGSIFGVLSFVVVHVALNVMQACKHERQFDSENKARRLIGLAERKF